MARRAVLATAAVLLLVVALSGACSDDGDGSDDTSGAGEPSPVVTLTAADLAGDYVLTATQAGPPVEGPRIVLTAKNEYEFFGVSPALPISEGSFAVSGDVVTLTDKDSKQTQTLRVVGDTLTALEGSTASPGDVFTREPSPDTE